MYFIHISSSHLQCYSDTKKLLFSGGESVCDNASLVYHIIRQKCFIWISHIIEGTEEQQQCM